jgi:hypothetical protein
MTVDAKSFASKTPLSPTLKSLLAQKPDRNLANDLLFLERWEICPLPGPASALRVSQIRRANPELAAAIRRELEPGLPFRRR